MQFSELDKKMRIYEASNDRCVLPGIYMVARIDGRSFTNLTKEKQKFEAPFDQRFRDMMVETVKRLMQCGFNVVYGYTQSDEISLLFDLSDTTFQRKERKLNSILAGEASAKFSLELGDLAAFDCRISQLPSKSLVIDYFRWRNEDACRNALNSYCYWISREEGLSPAKATSLLKGTSFGDKNEFLFKRGINFNDLPTWQKRGIGVYWETCEKPMPNSDSGSPIELTKRQLKVNFDLPMKDAYSRFVGSLIQ